jgi:hypothetical protein
MNGDSEWNVEPIPVQDSSGSEGRAFDGSATSTLPWLAGLLLFIGVVFGLAKTLENTFNYNATDAMMCVLVGVVSASMGIWIGRGESTTFIKTVVFLLHIPVVGMCLSIAVVDTDSWRSRLVEALQMWIDNTVIIGIVCGLLTASVIAVTMFMAVRERGSRSRISLAGIVCSTACAAFLLGLIKATESSRFADLRFLLPLVPFGLVIHFGWRAAFLMKRIRRLVWYGGIACGIIARAFLGELLNPHDPGSFQAPFLLTVPSLVLFYAIHRWRIVIVPAVAARGASESP